MYLLVAIWCDIWLAFTLISNHPWNESKTTHIACLLAFFLGNVIDSLLVLQSVSIRHLQLKVCQFVWKKRKKKKVQKKAKETQKMKKFQRQRDAHRDKFGDCYIVMSCKNSSEKWNKVLFHVNFKRIDYESQKWIQPHFYCLLAWCIRAAYHSAFKLFINLWIRQNQGLPHLISFFSFFFFF